MNKFALYLFIAIYLETLLDSKGSGNSETNEKCQISDTIRIVWVKSRLSDHRRGMEEA